MQQDFYQKDYFSRTVFACSTIMRHAVLLFSCLVLAVQASDVLEYTDDNFASNIKDHDVALVEFFAPWCGHCKKLAPEYERAATILLKNDPPVALVKVDCTANTVICGKYDVSGYPTLKLFKGGEMSSDYQGPRDSAGIVKEMLKHAGPSSKELKTVKEYEAFLAREGGCVVGFFKDGDSDEAKTFGKVADSYNELRFAHTSAKEILNKAKHEDKVVLFRPQNMKNKFEESEIICTEDITNKQKIKSFLDAEKDGLCPHRTQDNVGNKKPLIVAYYDVDYNKNPKGSNYWRNRVMKVGKKLNDEGIKAFFAISNKGEFQHELTECGQGEVESDGPVVCAFDEKNRKFKMDDSFSMDTFEKFVRDFDAGKLEAFLKSEPIPEDNSAPVKVVVGKNFDDIVNDPEKDVLIEFYAPWCGHCKTLAPKYDELAEKLSDEPGITIAKMDATANDSPSEYQVRGFPTIYFSPKGSKSSPKKYEGGREVNDFIKYLAKEATDELEGFDRKGKKKGDKQKKKTEL